MTARTTNIRAIRSRNNPLIDPSMLRGTDGQNVNGPCLIRVPEWVDRPLGQYYLYFAHHQGTYIRMAYSERVDGPYTVYAPGVLHQRDTIFGDGPVNLPHWSAHIASPEVIVDHAGRRLIMFYHGLGPDRPGCHCTSVATSEDGLQFTVPTAAPVFEETYVRLIEWDGRHYLIGRLGQIHRLSPDWQSAEKGPNPFSGILGDRPLRHCAVRPVDTRLEVFYSRIGDAPEHIVVSTIDLRPDWHAWTATPPVSILQPQASYEGIAQPIRPSRVGRARGPLHELRDPAIFEEDQVSYLLYSIAGESGIALAHLQFDRS